jgi:integrase
MRGTLVLDRICGPIGRLRTASGTHNREEWRKLNDMLTDLRKEGRWDVLKLLQDGTLTPLELYWKRFRGERLPNAKNLRPLAEALDTWLAAVENAESTKGAYAGVIARFTARHPDATLGALAELLAGEKGAAQAADTKPSWNLLRSLLLSFLGDTLGKRHELYMAVQDVPPFQVKHREGNPQTVEQVRALVQTMPKDAATIWALCLTGMRKGEYWGAWELLPDRIIVRGTKTKAALRTIPKVYPIALPRADYWRFVERLRDVTKGAVRPHDFRKTYAGWLEDAGVARTRRKMYLGHAVGDVTELYERRELTQYLVEDAERVRTWLGEPPTHQLHVVAG